ncbi:MAG: sigma-54 dependent transcriptional regulator [Xanthomonadales bacterium]|nr:sigma-54 dependent transcriptional regulator [Xanthomonadales bacterium]MDH3923672.1 sigma-54 dependent transcriptional regulator [Xanthomonadales bacterium]MDH3941534.1 sigma-54 dependent transcriptional regulator [Xanthomonadales bacterium]MDH4000373.1 sigma-54 dependent transcriptional regulator [Xanthomonadales bacterium]
MRESNRPLNMTQAHILVVDDEPDIRELVRDILEDEGHRVSIAKNGEAARMQFTASTPDLVLLDIWMPDVDGITLLREWSSGGGLECPIIIMSGHGTLETAIEATRLGAHDFVQKPISLAKLLSIVNQALEADKKGAKTTASQATHSSEPIGSSALMQVLRSKAEQAAQRQLPALISGEKGSGRENLARFIHDQGKLEGAFVVLDHGALVAGGARDYLNELIEKASQGSLFIPELQDLPDDALKALGQMLEADSRTLDCRLIASGSVNMLELARDDDLLQQLYFRLNVLPLQVPPLRDRPDDVPELVRFYAEMFPNQQDLPYRPFSVAAQNRLRNHPWPGNIRELRNLVQRLLVLGGEGEVSVAEVEEALQQNPPATGSAGASHPPFFDLPLREAREQFEREYLVYKLKEAGGSVGRLAESVGMERTHLYRKLRALGVDPKTAATSGGGQK